MEESDTVSKAKSNDDVTGVPPNFDPTQSRRLLGSVRPTIQSRKSSLVPEGAMTRSLDHAFESVVVISMKAGRLKSPIIFC